MQNIPDWKAVIKYVMGMLILAVVIAMALFFPEWYAKWQDEKINGQITLAHREQIAFLDTKSLDVAGKMKVIAETPVLSVHNTMWEYDPVYYDLDDYMQEEFQILEQYFGMQPDEMVQKAHNLTVDWCDAGLLPEYCRLLARWPNLHYLGAHMAYAEENFLTLLVMVFSDFDSDGMMLITDQDAEIIYYGCAVGAQTMEFMANEMGFASQEAIWRESMGGTVKASRVTMPEEFDLAPLCGAESAVVSGAEDELEFTAELQYTNFACSAQRKVILTDIGFGLAVWFGSDQIESFLYQLLERNGRASLMETDTRNYLEVSSVETEPAQEDEVAMAEEMNEKTLY